MKSFEGTLSKEESERICENFAILSQHVEPDTGMYSWVVLISNNTTRIQKFLILKLWSLGMGLRIVNDISPCFFGF